MKRLLVVLGVLFFAGCGADVATTAATSAAINKQAVDAGQQMKEMSDKKINEAAQAIQQHAKQLENEAK